MELERYHDAMERVPFDPDLETRVLSRLEEERRHSGQAVRPRRALRASLLSAAVVGILALSVSAAVVNLPVMRGYFGGSAGYEQSSALLDRAVTRDGWTLTLTDCVGDDRYLYLGLELTAPEGVVLDQASYRFENDDLSFPGMNNYVFSGGVRQLPDLDPTDNRLEFMLRVRGGIIDGSFNGKTMKLSVGNLSHVGAWNEAAESRERILDCDQTWDFGPVTVSYPDSTIRLEPNLPVTTLDVKAVITRVEVSPIGVYVRIEGEALKGHHGWVLKNAPDGYHGCIEYQEVTLYNKDGSTLTPYDDLSGSGCSGGENPAEPGQLTLVRANDALIDLSTLDHITICGVDIPLDFPAE